MLFHRGVVAIALAVLKCTLAAPTADQSLLREVHSELPIGLTNGERFARGLGANKPKRLFGESKTLHAAPAKRSAGAVDVTTSNLAFTTTTGPETKRGVSTLFATVVNGQLVTSTESQDAVALVMPYFESGAPFGSISWIPSATTGEFTAGQRYGMYGIMTNGIVTLRFGTPPDNAITDLFAPPSYPKGLRGRLVVDGGASREFIWVTDSEGGLYLAADMGTAIAQLSGVRSLLPVSYSIGAFPDFTDAIATKDTALVNPARLYAISYNTGRKGYVKIDTVYQNYLSIANDISQSTIFYAPNLNPGAATLQRLIASLNGEVVTVIASASWESVTLGTTADNTTDSLLFTVPPDQAGIVNLTVNGQTNYIPGVGMYSPILKAGTEASWPKLEYSNMKACIEIVPIGAEAQYCAPVVEEATFGVNPSEFYAATRSGSVGGYVRPQDDGKLTFAPTATTWFIPGDTRKRQSLAVYTKVGNRYFPLVAPATTSGSGIGPFTISTTGASTNIQIPTGRTGLIYPPEYIQSTYGPHKYYYHPGDRQIYAFTSDTIAQAFAPEMEELCLESVLPGASPEACSLYFENGAVDRREQNPVQIYARQVNATGTPITGWLTNTNNMGIGSLQSDAATWYLPGAPGTSVQMLTTLSREVYTPVVRPGMSYLPDGTTIDQAQPQVVPAPASPDYVWLTNWLVVPSLAGGVIQPQFVYNGNPVTWTWTIDMTEPYSLFRIFPDLATARRWLPNSMEFCFETVPVGGTPLGACEARDT